MPRVNVRCNGCGKREPLGDVLLARYIRRLRVAGWSITDDDRAYCPECMGSQPTAILTIAQQVAADRPKQLN
jgi:hypothetical protein